MRRYLAYCPDEEPRIFRMLDLIARGAQGRGPVHLLLISAAELGFAWDGDEKGWVRVSLPPLRMMTGPVQHFRSAIWVLGASRCLLGFLRGKVFGEVSLLICMALCNYLPRPHLRERDKMLVRAILCGVRLERIPSWQGQEGRCSLSFLWEEGW